MFHNCCFSLPSDSPIQQFINEMMYARNKKRRGSLYLRAYPRPQAFALPLCKDKQRSQPTPSDHIYSLMLYIIL